MSLSVSYTHLDVYKRQEHTLCALSRQLPAAAAVCIYAVIIYYILLSLFNCFFLSIINTVAAAMEISAVTMNTNR